MSDINIKNLDKTSNADDNDYFIVNTDNNTTRIISFKDLSRLIGGGVSTNKSDITSYYPDGVSPSNATAAQNVAAFNAASSATGGTVYFPPGSYNFSGQRLTLQNAATLRGDGPRLCQLNFGNVNDAIVVDHQGGGDNGELRISGLRLNKTGGSGSFVNYISRNDINTNQVIIQDVLLNGAGSSGLRFRNGTFVTVRDTMILSSTLTYGVVFENGPGPGDITSTNCLVDNLVCRDHNIGVRIQGVSEGISVVNSQFIAMTKGIDAEISAGTGEPYIYISGCHFDTRTAGIEFTNVIQSKIINNDMRRHASGANSPWTGVILNSGGSGSANFLNMISGNTFAVSSLGGSTRTGVYIDDSVYSIISQNMFHDQSVGVNVDNTYDAGGENLNVWVLDNMFFSVNDPITGTMFTKHPFDGASPQGTRNRYIIRNPKAYDGRFFDNYATFSDLKRSQYGVNKGDDPNGPLL
jgi:hypothetical protein